jgi:hypothetical protein
MLSVTLNRIILCMSETFPRSLHGRTFHTWRQKCDSYDLCQPRVFVPSIASVFVHSFVFSSPSASLRFQDGCSESHHLVTVVWGTACILSHEKVWKIHAPMLSKQTFSLVKLELWCNILAHAADRSRWKPWIRARKHRIFLIQKTTRPFWPDLLDGCNPMPLQDENCLLSH